MEERTKQRLVGIFVFIGALFIILPLMFHHSHPRARDLQDVAQNQAMPSASTQQTVVAMANQQSDTASSNTANTASGPNPSQGVSSQPPVNNNAMPAPNGSANSAAANPPPGPNPTTIPSIMPPQPASPASSSSTTAGAQAVVPASAPSAAGNSDQPGVTPNEQPNATSSTTSNTNSDVDVNAATDDDATAGDVQSSSNNRVSKPVALKTPAKKIAVAKQEGWSVQVGAFSQRKNVAELTQKLRQHHFKVYTKVVEHGNEKLTVVFVGPERQFAHAQFAQEHLRAEMHLDAQVKRCEV